jgi:hypothetical protein
MGVPTQLFVPGVKERRDESFTLQPYRTSGAAMSARDAKPISDLAGAVSGLKATIPPLTSLAVC